MSLISSYRADSNSASVNCVGNAPAPRNPVAAIASGSPGSNSSPATCQRMNWSNGMSRFRALITKSR